MLNLTAKLRNSLWGFKFAMTAIVLTSSLSTLRLAFNFGYYYHLFGCKGPTPITCFVSFVASYLLPVTLGLVLCAIGLWSRRFMGFVVSLIALVWIGEVYREWYTASLSNMQMFGARSFSELAGQQQHLLPLDQATWWDIIVLGVVLVVFIWQAVMLKRILKPIAAIPENQPTAESG